MMTTSLPLASLVLGLTAIACSSEMEEGEPSTTANTEASASVERSIQAMEDLTSYRMRFTFRPDGQIVTILADYVDPGDWYERLTASGESREAIEIILLGNGTYARSCDHYPDTCEPWEQSEERPPVPGGAGFTTTAPEILGLTALDHLEKAAIVPDDDPNRPLRHISGSVRIGKLILENKRRAYSGIEDYQQSCHSSDFPHDGPSSTPVCTYVSFEEYAEEEYGDVNFDLEPAAPIHIWMSPDDFLVHRIIIGTPGGKIAQEPPENERYFEVSYSYFNDVTITAPE